MSTHEEQIALLTDKLNVLENESRRLLTALNWASKTRMILAFCLLLFVAISVFMFYRLYVDIRTDRIAEVRQIISDSPKEFSEPLTRQVMLLAEEHGPHVVEVFRQQAQEDSQLYLTAFDAERTTMIANLQTNLEKKLNASYKAMLAEHEEMLQEEFPVLKDPEKLENIRANMEKIYDKIGKRYFVDSLRDEMESIARKIDTFPASQPKQDNIPLGEQIATELLELVRLMLVNSEHYVVPTVGAVSAQTPSKGNGDGPTAVDVELKDHAPEKAKTPDEDLPDSSTPDENDASGNKETSNEEDKSGEENNSKTSDDSNNG